MADDFKVLYQGQPGATATEIYTAGIKPAIIRRITVVDAVGSGATIKMWQDGSAAANVILPTTSLSAGGWGEFDGVIIVNSYGSIYAQANAASTVTVTIYGDEVG